MLPSVPGPLPTCAECGAVVGTTDSPGRQAPPGTAQAGNFLCPPCTAALASRILQGPNRQIRRARAAATRRRGDEKRKRGRR